MELKKGQQTLFRVANRHHRVNQNKLLLVVFRDFIVDARL